MSQPPRYSTLYPSLPPSSMNPAVLILDDEPAPSSGHSWPPIPATSQDTTTSTPVGSIGASRFALLAQQTLLDTLLRLHFTPQPIFLLNSQPPQQLQLQSPNTYTYTVPAMVYLAPPPILWTQPVSMMMQSKYIYTYLPTLPAGTMQFWQQSPLPYGMRPGDSVLILPSA